MSDNKTLYVHDMRQKFVVSVARDIVSFGMLIGTAVALNTLMPPSGWLNFGLALAWILWLAGRGAMLRERMTADEARAWLDREYPKAPKEDI